MAQQYTTVALQQCTVALWNIKKWRRFKLRETSSPLHQLLCNCHLMVWNVSLLVLQLNKMQDSSSLPPLPLSDSYSFSWNITLHDFLGSLWSPESIGSIHMMNLLSQWKGLLLSLRKHFTVRQLVLWELKNWTGLYPSTGRRILYARIQFFVFTGQLTKHVHKWVINEKLYHDCEVKCSLHILVSNAYHSVWNSDSQYHKGSKS